MKHFYRIIALLLTLSNITAQRNLEFSQSFLEVSKIPNLYDFGSFIHFANSFTSEGKTFTIFNSPAYVYSMISGLAFHQKIVYDHQKDSILKFGFNHGWEWETVSNSKLYVYNKISGGNYPSKLTIIDLENGQSSEFNFLNTSSMKAHFLIDDSLLFLTQGDAIYSVNINDIQSQYITNRLSRVNEDLAGLKLIKDSNNKFYALDVNNGSKYYVSEDLGQTWSEKTWEVISDMRFDYGYSGLVFSGDTIIFNRSANGLYVTKKPFTKWEKIDVSGHIANSSYYFNNTLFLNKSDGGSGLTSYGYQYSTDMGNSFETVMYSELQKTVISAALVNENNVLLLTKNGISKYNLQTKVFDPLIDEDELTQIDLKYSIIDMNVLPNEKIYMKTESKFSIYDPSLMEWFPSPLHDNRWDFYVLKVNDDQIFVRTVGDSAESINGGGKIIRKIHMINANQIELKDNMQYLKMANYMFRAKDYLFSFRPGMNKVLRLDTLFNVIDSKTLDIQSWSDGRLQAFEFNDYLLFNTGSKIFTFDLETLTQDDLVLPNEIGEWRNKWIFKSSSGVFLFTNDQSLNYSEDLLTWESIDLPLCASNYEWISINSDQDLVLICRENNFIAKYRYPFGWKIYNDLTNAVAFSNSVESNYRGNDNLFVIGNSIFKSIPNRAPNFIDSQTNNYLVNEDESINIEGTASDADDDYLQYYASFDSSLINVSISSSILTLTPKPNKNGEAKLNVFATDGISTDSTLYTLNITPVNDAPTITAIPNDSTNEETEKVIVLSASDVEGDALTYSASSGTIAVAVTISSDTLKLTPALNYTGTSKITVVVSDNVLKDTTTFNLKVIKINDPPVWGSPISDITIKEDSSATFSLNAIDVDGDALTYISIADTSAITVTSSNDTLKLIPQANWNGSSVITAIASDGIASDSTTFTLTVTSVNDAPSLPDTTFNEDTSISIVYTIQSGVTLGAKADTSAIKFSMSNNNLSITPDADYFGSSAVTLTAYEGTIALDSAFFTVTVKQIQDAPYAFDWVSTASDTIDISQSNLAETYELKWSESKDVDGETIDYLLYVKIGVLEPEEIYDTTSTSVPITYQEFAENAFEPFPMLPRVTVQFSMEATDGIDTVKITGDNRVLFINRYEYLSTVSEGIPTEFALHENYPNPFNPTTTLRFDLPEVSDITLIIYNMLGQKVKTFKMQNTPAGYHSVTWDATNDLGQQVGAGVYLYQLQAKDFVKTRKMVLLK